MSFLLLKQTDWSHTDTSTDAAKHKQLKGKYYASSVLNPYCGIEMCILLLLLLWWFCIFVIVVSTSTVIRAVLALWTSFTKDFT